MARQRIGRRFEFDLLNSPGEELIVTLEAVDWDKIINGAVKRPQINKGRAPGGARRKLLWGGLELHIETRRKESSNAK